MNHNERVEQQRNLLQKIRDDDESLIAAGEKPPLAGAMDDPDGYGAARTDCGDMVEIYLKMDGMEIAQTSYLIKGCIYTLASGRAAAIIGRGKTMADAKRATEPDEIEAKAGGLPEENYHCAQLASEAMSAALEDVAATLREPWRKTYRRRR